MYIIRDTIWNSKRFSNQFGKLVDTKKKSPGDWPGLGGWALVV
jgi:hypothetical protein